jgi:hypothetical protein
MKLPSKEQMLDTMGRPITQSLFLEIGYTDTSVFTLKEYDYEYKGQTYPSLKRLYLEEEDPTEYDFACKYLLGWKHWQRILENKSVRAHIDEWREELEVKLRSRGVKALMLSAVSGNHQSAKWMADRGWDIRAAGRPSKAEKEGELKKQTAIIDEYKGDVLRLFKGGN